jgi:homoserine dehydrogenase
MTTVVNTAGVQTRAAARIGQREIRVALLGLGQVGGAVASIAQQNAIEACHFTITSALVRDIHRPRTVDVSRLPLTTDPNTVLRDSPDVVVEVLGGLEPARSIVLAALVAGVPVVTANKSLLAAHGDELFDLAARRGVPLLYEASVLAGVPFLGTFRRRPLARDVSALRGIVNGTSNYVLSRMAHDRVSFNQALIEAQRSGYAEPDPSKDVNGDDAAEKLCVLLRHFAGTSVAPHQIETVGITDIEEHDLDQASAFDGAIRPVITADWNGCAVRGYAGPAFVERSNLLARVDGVQNALTLTTRWSGDVFLSGPGAGPTVTAATVLDDIVEAHHLAYAGAPATVHRATQCTPPATGWFVGLTSRGEALSDETQAQQMLARFGIRVRRASPIDRRDGRARQWLLTAACSREHADAALAVLDEKLGWTARSIRVLE